MQKLLKNKQVYNYFFINTITSREKCHKLFSYQCHFLLSSQILPWLIDVLERCAVYK